jgi:hypothetical protein
MGSKSDRSKVKHMQLAILVDLWIVFCSIASDVILFKKQKHVNDIKYRMSLAVWKNLAKKSEREKR